MNSTLCSASHTVHDCYPTLHTPFYYSSAPYAIPNIPDHVLAIVAPIVAYWALSFVFHALDVSGWAWLDQYRIHESEEVRSRNLVTRSQVVWAVILQQVIQTVLGWWWVEDQGTVTETEHIMRMEQYAPAVLKGLSYFLDEKAARARQADTVYFVYWWAIPVAQFFFAMFIIDTWQYFLHRAMHVNKWLYKHFHSVHHRLYVPYAFGALYNHPLEGFLLDTLGAAIAESLSRMTVRQAALLFAISTLKTVDDHCGYKLPFDPIQWLSTNDADYHDIHHQVIGIKSNFSQPFFVHWDVLLGTRMTREDVLVRRQKPRHKIQ